MLLSKGQDMASEVFLLWQTSAAVPLQRFLSKTCSPGVSTPQIDRVFYPFGKLKDCSGFASFWCTGNFTAGI